MPEVEVDHTYLYKNKKRPYLIAQNAYLLRFQVVSKVTTLLKQEHVQSSHDWLTKYNRATTLLFLADCLFRSPAGSPSRVLSWDRFDRVLVVVDVCWEGRKRHLPGKQLCGRDNTNEVLQGLQHSRV